MFSELSGVRILLLPKYLFFYTEGIQIPESGIFLFLESGIWKVFAYEIRNPGLWNPDYGSWNPQYH